MYYYYGTIRSSVRIPPVRGNFRWPRRWTRDWSRRAEVRAPQAGPRPIGIRRQNDPFAIEGRGAVRAASSGEPSLDELGPALKPEWLAAAEQLHSGPAVGNGVVGELVHWALYGSPSQVRAWKKPSGRRPLG